MKKKLSIILFVILLVVTGCSGVEPERRAYPLIMSIDYRGGNYQVIYGMANLPEQTAQDKSNMDSEQYELRPYTGNSMEDILELYNKSQEYYLDLGHVQVLVLGTSLLENKEKLEEILGYLEKEPVIGDNLYVFTSGEPTRLMSLNGTSIESLSDYLVGIYQNRIVNQKDKMMTLQQIYNAWHNEDEYLLPPQILLENNVPTIPLLTD